ncbi:MAG: DASS family sodium-coupled anion symporter [Bdellovibrionota bacterium]
MNAPAKFDRRPLFLVLGERLVRWLVFGVLAWVLFDSLGEPWGEGLEPKAQRALAIFFVCVALWVLHLLPLMITSLLAIVLPVAMGVVTRDEGFALFGNHVVFFLLGVFILAAALADCGLAERITLTALRLSGGSPRKLSLGVFLTGAGMSTIMSEHAVAAMLFPIVLEIARVLELDTRRSNLGRLLFLSMSWGCITGGVLTILGGGRVPLAIGILEQTTGETMRFSEWTLGILPAGLLTLAVAYTILALFFPIEKTAVAPAEEFLRQRERKLGLLSMREKLVGGIVAATILAWIVEGHGWGIAEISLFAVVIIFSLKLITWRKVEELVNWGVLLMYGGAISLGFLLSRTGAAAWVARKVLESGEISPFVFVAVLAAIALLLTEAISNSAVVSVLLPVALGLAGPLGLSPKGVTYIVAMISGLGFVLPMGTPANTLAFSSGYLRVRHVVVPGLLLDLAAYLLFLAMIKWYWPLIGVSGF